MRPSKRDELVQKALKVFYANGFHATGMDMLVAQTGISKTSMYKYFATKEDLVLATLKLRDELFLDWFFTRMEELADTPNKQLIAMFDVLSEWFEQKGFASCMFIKASAEFQAFTHPIHMLATEHKNLMLTRISQIAKAAEFSDPQNIARQLMLLIEGATVTAHFGHTDDPAGDAKKVSLILLTKAAVGNMQGT